MKRITTIHNHSKRSLWNYDFMPDVGPHMAHHQRGRPYALSDEDAMLMDTNPRDNPDPYGTDVA